MQDISDMIPEESRVFFNAGKTIKQDLQSIYGQKAFEKDIQSIQMTENQKTTLMHMYVLVYKDINQVFGENIKKNKPLDEELIKIQEQYNTLQPSDEEILDIYKHQISLHNDVSKKILTIAKQATENIIKQILKGEVICENEIMICKLLIKKMRSCINCIQENLEITQHKYYEVEELGLSIQSIFATLKEDVLQKCNAFCQQYEERINSIKYIKFASKEEEIQKYKIL